MIRFTIAAGILMSAWVSAEEPVRQDLLRFSNGDQLHGSFEGIAEGPKAIWKREDVDLPLQVAPGQVRQIVLNGGRPKAALTSLSYAALVNGDRVPGVLKSMDGKSVVLETSFAGEVSLPREQVAMMAPSPLGGRLVYHGPYDEKEWSMVSALEPDGVKSEEKEETANSGPGRWGFSGSAWYWKGGRPGTALIRREGMPDKAVLRFHIAWKNRSSFAVAFHADFKRPAPKEGEPPVNAAAQQFAAADPSYFPKLFGSSYVIQMNGNNVMLYRSGFDEEGNQTLDAIRANSYNARFSEAESAVVEIRCNRVTGEIALFINDEFVSQWSEGGNEMAAGLYAGKGSGYGFLVQGQATPVRVSDIAMAEWNGMPDSARSLQVDEQDIVLLANGTDRFSGKVTGFNEGAVSLEGKYGGFRFPLDEIAEIRFARKGLAKAVPTSGSDVMIHLYPLGRVSGKPVTGTSGNVRLLTHSSGEWNVNLDSAVILDFNPSSSFLDDWDVQF